MNDEKNTEKKSGGWTDFFNSAAGNFTLGGIMALGTLGAVTGNDFPGAVGYSILAIADISKGVMQKRGDLTASFETTNLGANAVGFGFLTASFLAHEHFLLGSIMACVTAGTAVVTIVRGKAATKKPDIQGPT